MQPKENTYLSTTFSLLSKQNTKLFQKAKTPGFGNYLPKKYKANTPKKKGKTAGFGNDKNFTADTRGV